MRLFCATVLILGLAMPTEAQEDRGWSFAGSLSGSANSTGVVTKLDPVLGYSFNKHFSMYGGVPFYFVNSSSTTTSTGTPTSGESTRGIGNTFAGLRAAIDTDAVNYSSNLEFTAPTGDESKGFSTGNVTVDWTNHFSRTFSSLTPFVSAGIANTVSDTAFFIRPFTSDGVVGHFEGGAMYDATNTVRLAASAYAVRGSGEQRLRSRVVRGGSGVSGGRDRVFETGPDIITQSDAVNDHGFSTWLSVSPKPQVNFHTGYSRSVNYDYNSVFFGIGFRIGQ